MLYRTLFIALAVAVVVLAATAAPDPAAFSLDRFVGSTIARGRVVPVHLGAETFSAVGAYSGGVGWLGALSVYLLIMAGEPLARFATALLALGTLALVEMRASRTAGRAYGLGAAALAATCMPGTLGVGGGIATAAFAAALSLLLQRPGPRSALAGTLLTIVWCNAGPEGLLGPVIAVCIAAFRRPGADPVALVERKWARVACAGTALGTLATPAFWAYPALAFEAARVDRALAGLVPYHPVDIVPLVYRTGFVLIVVLALAIGMQRVPEGSALLFAVFLLLALANGSYIVTFAVIAAPLLAEGAAGAFPIFLSTTLGSRRGDVIAGTVAAAAAAAFAWHAGRSGIGLPAGYALASAVGKDGASHRLYCTTIDWCDAALGSEPRVKVFVDGRVAAYPPEILDEQRDIRSLKGDWRKQLDDLRVDTLVAQKDRAFSTLIASSPGWHVVSDDDVAVLYERGVRSP